MKKLLTIVAVAIVLCLGISAAVAATYSGRLQGWELENLLSDSTNIFDNGTDEWTNIRLESPTLAQLRVNPAAHGAGTEGYVNAKVTGHSKQTGKDATTEIQVRMSTHDDYEVLDYAASTFSNCEEGGKLVYKCTFPGCTYTRTEEYKPVPHSFVEQNTATCTDKGKLYEKCSVCGFYAKDALGNPVYKKDGAGKVIETAALGHIFEGKPKYVTTVACDPNTQRLAEGKVFQVCSRCGKNAKEILNVTNAAYPTDGDKVTAVAAYIKDWSVLDGHSFEKTPYKTFAATCTKNGGATYWCTNCGWMSDELDPKQPALGHVWGLASLSSCRDVYDYWDYDDVTDTYTHKVGSWALWACSRCGEEVIPDSEDASSVYDSNGNYTGVKVVAKIDGKTYTATFAHSYKATGRIFFTSPVGDEENLSDINEDNYSKEELIRWCNEGYKYTEAKCEACGHRISRREKLGHDYTAWEVVNDKEDYGTTTSRFQRVCQRCSYLDSKVSSGVPCGDNEHDWIPVDKTKTKCESMNPGTALICTKCGAKKTADYPIIEHNWQEVAVSKIATCTEAGSRVVKCSNCGAMKEEDIPVVAHTLTKIEKVPATCKATGTEEYYKCDDCGKLFSDAEGKTEIEKPAEIAIDKDAHVWDEGKVTKEATTEEAGEKTYTCTVCGKTKTEEIAKLVAPTAYTTNFEFDSEEMTLTGTATHTEGTEEAGKPVYARVTYFMADGTYIVVSVPVEADGSFESMNSGNVIHVSVQIVDSAKVRPGEFTRFGGDEKDVK